MGIKIGIGLCFYEDLQSLKRCLPLISPHVDYIFAIDGRFSLCEGNDYSSKETQDYVKSFPNVVYEQFIGMEHEKRNRYVRLAAEYGCDVLMVHDSDEFVIEDRTDWDKFKKDIEYKLERYPRLHFFSIEMLYTPPEFHPPEYTPIPKLWTHLDILEYYKCHNIFRNIQTGETCRAGETHLVVIDGLKQAWDDKLRSQEYLDQVCKYQGKMLDYEIPLRKLHRKGGLK
jgi:hypothetical protein